MHISLLTAPEWLQGTFCSLQSFRYLTGIVPSRLIVAQPKSHADGPFCMGPCTSTRTIVVYTYRLCTAMQASQRDRDAQSHRTLHGMCAFPKMPAAM